MTRPIRGFIVLAFLIAGVASACGDPDPPGPNQPMAIAGAKIGGQSPGSLLSAETIPDLDPSVAAAGIRAALITYRSTDASNGASTVVTGTVFVPKRLAPEGGWRVIALGHGSTGIDTGCAPSGSRTLADQVELVIKLVSLGVIVTMADYQGLGGPGLHPYLDSATAGRNIIDSVRAARRTFVGVSKRWGALGGSQGGGAVWAANEQSATYAPALDLVGVVALAPATDVSGLVDKAVAGTLTTDQRSTLQWALESMSRLYPDIDLDDYRRGSAATDWDLLASCADKEDKVGTFIGPDDLTPNSPAAAARIRAYLTQWALPQGRLNAPMLVAYGGKDTFLEPAWTDKAIATACRLGGVIERKFDPDGTHAAMDAGDPLQWLAERFAGLPVSSNCPPR